MVLYITVWLNFSAVEYSGAGSVHHPLVSGTEDFERLTKSAGAAITPRDNCAGSY